jgi:hypothetical protein
VILRFYLLTQFYRTDFNVFIGLEAQKNTKFSKQKQLIVRQMSPEPGYCTEQRVAQPEPFLVGDIAYCGPPHHDPSDINENPTTGGGLN